MEQHIGIMKNEDGNVIMFLAVFLFSIVTLFMILIVDTSAVFLASQQLRTITESSALQGAATAQIDYHPVIGTIECPFTGEDIEIIEYYEPYIFLEQIDAFEEAQVVISKYENEGYLYKNINIENVSFQLIVEDVPPDVIPFPYDSSLEVTITANVRRYFPVFWSESPVSVTRSSTVKAEI